MYEDGKKKRKRLKGRGEHTFIHFFSDEKNFRQKNEIEKTHFSENVSVLAQKTVNNCALFSGLYTGRPV